MDVAITVSGEELAWLRAILHEHRDNILMYASEQNCGYFAGVCDKLKAAALGNPVPHLPQWNQRHPTGTSPDLATDPRRKVCPTCGAYLYPDQLCETCNQAPETGLVRIVGETDRIKDILLAAGGCWHSCPRGWVIEAQIWEQILACYSRGNKKARARAADVAACEAVPFEAT